MNESIIKKIKSLPPLPKSIMDIQRITSDPNGSIADLIKVVKDDPMLTANLLKAANSPLYGFSRQIKTVDQAVSLFGMSTVKGFAISSAIRNNMKIDLGAYGVSEEQFLLVSQKQNALIVNWYKRGRNRLDVLSTASFLIEIGAIVISAVLVAEGLADEFRIKLKQGIEREKLEKDYVGSDTIDVTAEIFNHWKFAPELADSIKYANKLDEASDIGYSAPLAVAYKIVDLLKPFDEKKIEEGMAIAKKYNLDFEALQDAIEIVK
jgi:HD-like signal output (HDOD) protein